MARNNVKKAKGAPWGVIIFFLIFFFYIGIPLMLSKLHKDKEHMLANAKKTMTVGWIIFGFGVIYMVVCLAEGLAAEGVSGIRTLVIGTAVSCSGGYAIVRHAKKYKMLGLKHERYILAASRLPVGSLDDMAYVLGETFEVTSQNVQDLIDNGLLEDSYIDQTRRILVSPVVGSRYRTQLGQGSADTGDAPQAKDSKPEVRAVKCPNCGGMNYITNGAGNICDYCGSPLE